MNTIHRDAPPILVNAMNEAFVRTHTNKAGVSINVNAKPFKLTKREKEMNNIPSGFSASTYFVVALAMIPASIGKYFNY